MDGDLYDVPTGDTVELLRILRDAGLGVKLTNKIKKRPYLAKRMVDAIDDQPQQVSPKSSFPWTPVDQYVDRIMARSQLRGWGFTFADALMLATKLHDHDGPLAPTGVSIWLGKNLSYSWNEMMAWIADEVKKLGFTFQTYFDSDQLSFYPGSEVTSKRKLDVVELDIATFWDPTNGVIPRNVRSTRPKWPGLEVATLLALNPQLYVAMDGETIPYMLAAGLVVGSGYQPYFSRDHSEVYVHDYWGDHRWQSTSVVAFRE